MCPDPALQEADSAIARAHDAVIATGTYRTAQTKASSCSEATSAS